MKFDRISNADLLIRFNSCGEFINSDDETAQIYKRVKSGLLFVKWNDNNTIMVECDESDINRLT